MEVDLFAKFIKYVYVYVYFEKYKSWIYDYICSRAIIIIDYTFASFI